MSNEEGDSSDSSGSSSDGEDGDASDGCPDSCVPKLTKKVQEPKPGKMPRCW
jgi:hypothetical protein